MGYFIWPAAVLSYCVLNMDRTGLISNFPSILIKLGDGKNDFTPFYSSSNSVTEGLQWACMANMGPAGFVLSPSLSLAQPLDYIPSCPPRSASFFDCFVLPDSFLSLIPKVQRGQSIGVLTILIKMPNQN